MCTGQSNMEMPVYSENPFWRTLDAVEELKKADHPRIRLYNSMLTRRLAPDGPLTEENGNGWQPKPSPCFPHAATFSDAPWKRTSTFPSA